MEDSLVKQRLDDKTLSDWFLPAVLASGNLKDSLDAAALIQKKRLTFLTQLRLKLWDQEKPDFDRLTRLGILSKDLERTLRFRLGLLNPERKPAWFRRSIKSDFGPFKAKALLDPVFLDYPEDQQERLEQQISAAYKAGRTGPLCFLGSGVCLWTYLLERKSELSELSVIEVDGSKLKLIELADSMPYWLNTASLRAFIKNVSIEYLSAEKTLETCFEQLWTASKIFWNHARAERLRQPHVKQKQSFYDVSEPLFQTPFLSFEEMAALRFMGFEKAPDLTTLKSRFRQLARKMHPDVGGNDESFRHLNNSFEKISDLISKS